ncbi:MAG: TetR/AcrR family transcriptional regulator [Caulobacterales bacterium]|nr:TetR/AcrR family transcriptional regulator [Caulobacterales bacterium]
MTETREGAFGSAGSNSSNPNMGAAPVRRGRGRPPGNRPSQILKAASHLFYVRGYNATSIDDIGQAAGVSGPAVYRHFATKDEILVSLMEEAADRSEAVIRHIYMIGGAPIELLERFICCEVRQSIEAAEMLTVASNELHNLQPKDLARVQRRGRINREEYANLIAAIRPDLSDVEIRTMVIGIKGAINYTVGMPMGLPPDHLELLLVDMVFGIVNAPRRADRDFIDRNLDEQLKAPTKA